MSKLWFIETTSFVGSFALGAEHYYPKIDGPDRIIDVHIVLDEAYAQELTKKDMAGFAWLPGDTTNRFKTERQAISAGLAVAASVIEPRDAVVAGSSSYSEPHEPLRGPQEFMSSAEELWLQWQQLQKAVGEDVFTFAPTRAGELADGWEKLIKDFQGQDYNIRRTRDQLYVQAKGNDWVVFAEPPDEEVS